MAKKIKLSPLAKRVLNVVIGLLMIGLYLKNRGNAPEDASASAPQADIDTRSAQEAAVRGPAKTKNSAPIQATGDDAPIRVGTWNLEWLGTPDRRRGSNGSGRSQGELELIAETIDRDIALDVVILNEINLQSKQWVALSKALNARGFRTYTPSARADQETAIAYRSSRIKTTGATKAIDNGDVRVGRCRSGVRRPIVANLRAGAFDFTVIGVHFRSQRPSDCGGEDFHEDVRAEEVERILEEIEEGQRRGKIDQDVIITGDFNIESDHSSLKGLRKDGMIFVTDEGSRSRQSGNVSYRRGRHGSAIDHVVISQGAIREYVPGSAQHLALFSTLSRNALDTWQATFSDHAPTWASFKVDGEDDD